MSTCMTVKNQEFHHAKKMRFNRKTDIKKRGSNHIVNLYSIKKKTIKRGLEHQLGVNWMKRTKRSCANRPRVSVAVVGLIMVSSTRNWGRHGSDGNTRDRNDHKDKHRKNKTCPKAMVPGDAWSPSFYNRDQQNPNQEASLRVPTRTHVSKLFNTSFWVGTFHQPHPISNRAKPQVGNRKWQSKCLVKG